LKFNKLSASFLSNIHLLKEAEQKENRPYSMITIDIGSFMYAVPLRSNIKHNYCYKTIEENSEKKGLDFSKALIVDVSDIGEDTLINETEYEILKENYDHIRTQFSQYVKKYIGYFYPYPRKCKICT
jgi:protein AbiQ